MGNIRSFAKNDDGGEKESDIDDDDDNEDDDDDDDDDDNDDDNDDDDNHYDPNGGTKQATSPWSRALYIVVGLILAAFICFWAPWKNSTATSQSQGEPSTIDGKSKLDIQGSHIVSGTRCPT